MNSHPHPTIDSAVSPWVTRYAHLIKASGRVLDVACGSGRHVRWLASQGHQLTGLDRDAQALAGLQGVARCVMADIENGPWPLPGETFDGVVVTNYLWRELFPTLLQSLAPDGVLIYETFAQGQQTVGRPARAEFLLQPGELLRQCSTLRVVAFEDGFEPAQPRYVQRIVAVNEVPRQGLQGLPTPPRHELRGLPMTEPGAGS